MSVDLRLKEHNDYTLTLKLMKISIGYLDFEKNI